MFKVFSNKCKKEEELKSTLCSRICTVLAENEFAMNALRATDKILGSNRVREIEKTVGDKIIKELNSFESQGEAYTCAMFGLIYYASALDDLENNYLKGLK